MPILRELIMMNAGVLGSGTPVEATSEVMM